VKLGLAAALRTAKWAVGMHCLVLLGPDAAEEVLPALLSRYATRALPPDDGAQAENMSHGEPEEAFDRIVAVVDPPRSGLHPIVRSISPAS